MKKVLQACFHSPPKASLSFTFYSPLKLCQPKTQLVWVGETNYTILPLQFNILTILSYFLITPGKDVFCMSLVLIRISGKHLRFRNLKVRSYMVLNHLSEEITLLVSC